MFLKHPYLTLGLGLGGLLLAYDTWGRSPGDKTVIGDVVRVDVKDASALGATGGFTARLPLTGPLPAPLPVAGLPPGTFAYVLVTATDAASGYLRGRLTRLQLSDRAIDLKNTPPIMVETSRRAVLPLRYGVGPVPVTTV